MVADGLEFDGVFCVTDTVAMGVLRGLADAGVRVPERVKVIGFDNVDESAFLVPLAVHGGSGSRPDGEADRRPARCAARECGSAGGSGGVRRPVLPADPRVDRRESTGG
nr:substrate-binding domain-containing protein [Streptomyces puniciscabiei]